MSSLIFIYQLFIILLIEIMLTSRNIMLHNVSNVINFNYFWLITLINIDLSVKCNITGKGHLWYNYYIGTLNRFN